MNKTRSIVVAVVVPIAIVALVVVGVAALRPDLMPGWARPMAERLAGGAPAGGDEAEDVGLYCREHGVPEKFCTLCHAELNDTLMLCKEHGGLPEDICTLCHPEVEERYDLVMCEEHGLPEAYCYKCGNGPSAEGAGPSASVGADPADAWCAAHRMPEALCPDCVGQAGGDCLAMPLPPVRLDSGELAARIGFESAEAIGDRHAHHLVANAETAYDGNALAEVYPRVRGFLSEVRVDLGQRVEAGDVLAVVDSSEVAAARTRYLSALAAVDLARVNYERTSELTRREVVAAKRELEDFTALNHAEADLMAARQELYNLNLTYTDLEELAETKDSSNALAILAPIGGMIVEREAVRGEAVEPTTRLFAVADTESMWLWLDVEEASADLVATGQAVRFAVPKPGEREPTPVAEGRITWVGTEIDPVTRTARVRAEVANPAGRLRANLFGRASIRLGDEHDAVLVPGVAVQRGEDADVVFLADAAGVYTPRRVLSRPAERPEFVEVSWGLEPGERVVTTGSYLLKTELMRGAIGAGCCE